MTIRFLNCGSMRPYFPRVENGITCLLAESNQGIVLVDTGFGIGDYQDSGRTIRFFLAAMRSPKDVNETALYQVKRLGYQAEEVQNIVMTHLHIDHAGGLPDFPHARVHVYKPEYDHITKARVSWEYHSVHWQHRPKWVTHELCGEHWYDFDAIQLKGFEPEIWLVPLTGHTPGHSAVAIRTDTGWVLHGGDAVPFNMAVDAVPDRVSRLLIGPHVPRIREFQNQHPEVQIVGAHMSLDFYDKHRP